jgi:hypothetical protein
MQAQVKRSYMAVSLMDAEAGQCRWPISPDGAPVSEFLFCGQPTADGQSWCDCHRAIGYEPRQARHHWFEQRRRPDDRGARVAASSGSRQVVTFPV